MAASLALLFTACGTSWEPEDGDVTVREGAIGESGCATATADRTFSSGARPIFVSAQTYSNAKCFKAVVVDMTSYSGIFLGAGTAPGGTYVEWADALPAGPTAASACTSTFVRADLYTRSGTTWVMSKSVRANGTWSTSTFTCHPAVVKFLQGDLQAGQSYRFTLTARSSGSSSAPTRKVRIDSRQPAQIAEFSVGTQSFPEGIVRGPDGNLWFTVTNGIGKITTAGTVNLFNVGQVSVRDLTLGPDQNIWFAETGVNAIGRITLGGTLLASFPASTPIRLATAPDGNVWYTSASPMVGRLSATGAALPQVNVPGDAFGIAGGPDGNVWLGLGVNGVDRVTPTLAQTDFALASSVDDAGAIIAGPSSNMWFTEPAANNIGHISTNGGPFDFAIPTPSSQPSSLTMSASGTAVWFSEQQGNKIGTVNTAGNLSEFALPTADCGPGGIVVGPDGNVWFTEFNAGKIGRLHVGP